MRFFSNDKESRDDQQNVDVRERAEQVNAEQAHDEHPERVASDPVAVPQQRAGSPWSSAPDGGDTPPGDEGGVPFHEPAPQPTAFGASTVGGAVAASAMANPQNDTWSATDRDSAADSGVGDDRTVAPGDGLVADDGRPLTGPRGDDVVDVALDDQGSFDDPHVRGAGTTTREDTTPPDARGTDIAADGTVTGGQGAEVGTAAAGTLEGATVAGAAAGRHSGDRDATGDRDADADRDPALKDDGTFDAPRAVDPATDRPLEDGTATGAAAGFDRDPALKDDGTFDGPKAVDPNTDRPLAGPARSTPDAVPVPVTTPSTGAAGTAGSFFDAGDAQAFQERWRDVQLQFVDSPKEATAQAAGLVDEAVDRLAASLRDQKGRLAGGGGAEDTEKLRVELRAYRDLLNRILGL